MKKDDKWKNQVPSGDYAGMKTEEIAKDVLRKMMHAEDCGFFPATGPRAVYTGTCDPPRTVSEIMGELNGERVQQEIMCKCQFVECGGVQQSTCVAPTRPRMVYFVTPQGLAGYACTVCGKPMSCYPGARTNE